MSQRSKKTVIIGAVILLFLGGVIASKQKRQIAADSKQASVFDLLTRPSALDKAVRIAEEKLRVSERIFGPRDLHVARQLDELASHYHAQGLLAEFITSNNPAIRERFKQYRVPDYSAEEKKVSAESLFKRALAIREQALGPDALEVAESSDRLAYFYGVEGRNAEAELFYKRALQIREKVLGQKHTQVAHSLTNLAIVYAKQHKNADAEASVQRSLAIYEALGPDRPEMVGALMTYSLVLKMAGKNQEAGAMEARARRIR